MRTLVLVILLSSLCMGQNRTYTNDYKFIKKWTTNGTTLSNSDIRKASFTVNTVDTTEAIQIGDYKTILLNLQSFDSATILIKYQLALDTVSFTTGWSTLTTIDSLTQSADGSVIKSKDLTSTVLGAKFVRFVFDFDNVSGYLGSTSPKYSATILLRKY